MKRLLPLLLIQVLIFLLPGCAGKELEIDDSANSAEQLYADAKRNLDNARFPIAKRYFEELETRYPFSPYALQARLDLAYAYVLAGITEEAVSEADKFIRFNPTHPSVDYAYYIRGIANFGQSKRFMGSWFPRDSADFEQSVLIDAYNDFSFLLRNFPDSKYAADARQRMIFLRNTFARHEVHVAEYYLRKKAWIAAANRASYILQTFAETPSNRDALAILLQSYRALRLNSAASDTEKVLRLNYPHHPLLQESTE